MSKVLKMGSGLLNLIYPIGSIYITMNTTNPSALFGGTWQQLEGRFLLGVGSTTDDSGNTRFYGNGSTGGEYSHTLTTNEMPAHTHNINGYAPDIGFGDNYYVLARGFQNYGMLASQNAGGNQSHNNMPPFLAVFMWKRTA